MRTLSTRSLLIVAASAALAAMAACPGGGGVPGKGGGGVDPDKCGNYADVSDAGRKLHAFLQATAELQTTVNGIEAEVRTGCDAMAKELGIAPKGSNKEVCDAVFKQLRDDLSAGVKAQASLNIKYKPAVCTINVEAAASASAECEAQASGSAKVTCEGTCHGTCDGTCKGSTGKGGECNGECAGTCSGECEGGADVQGSAECEARGEVHAAAEMKCTPAELTVEAQASAVVDKPRADRAIAAMKAGLPQILTVSAKIKPLKGAVETWVATAKGVTQAGKELAGQFKDQALCLTAQISAAGAAVADVQASFSFSVDVSVEASASASGGAG